MERKGLLRSIAADGDLLVGAAEEHPAADVVTCPGWCTLDLLLHVGRVHRWAAEIVRTHADARRAFPPAPDANPFSWFREGADALCKVLNDADPASTVWNFTGRDSTAGWWIRRQAHETSVHRWDAEHAVGYRPVIETDIAADGLDEALTTFLPAGRRAVAEIEATVTLRATDAGREWRIEASPQGVLATRAASRPPHGADASAEGPAADLLLAVWGRKPWSAVEVGGDPCALEAARVR